MCSSDLVIAAAAFVFVPTTTSPSLLVLLSFIIGLGVGCGQPLSMSLTYNAAPPGRAAETIAMRLAASYGAHVFIPTTFGALGSLLGLAPVFWLCAVALTGGSVMNGRRRQPPT